VAPRIAARAQEKDMSHAPAARPSRVHWRKIVVNADSDFEAATAADVNGDGKLDIICGDTWYEAPNWTPHKFREIGAWGKGPGSSGYRQDFADIAVDVNGDGKIDVVSSDYATGEIWWSENPGSTDQLWTKHLIAKPGSAETTVVAPILGKKAFCILPNVGSEVVWYELRKVGKEPQWVEHVVGKEGAGHGIGYGDVNKDGKTDIITPHGWYENVDALHDKWIWHKDFECQPGDLGIGTPTMDFAGTGRNDIVFGSGHHYGLYWLHHPDSPTGKWTQETIDASWSQAHALFLVDVEGTHHPVIVTGKRYLAHDHDPGAQEPMGVFYYSFDRKSRAWQKFVIDDSGKVGTGLAMTAADMFGTGRQDLICPGKSGLYLFVNEGK
jgi:hypothetical protein